MKKSLKFKYFFSMSKINFVAFFLDTLVERHDLGTLKNITHREAIMIWRELSEVFVWIIFSQLFF